MVTIKDKQVSIFGVANLLPSYMYMYIVKCTKQSEIQILCGP